MINEIYTAYASTSITNKLDRNNEMTKEEFDSMLEKIDRSKIKMFENGTAYELVTLDGITGKIKRSGIGTGSDMATMITYSILSLFTASGCTNIEEFAENVKRSIIKAQKENAFSRIDCGVMKI